MSALTQIVASFDNQELGKLAAKVSRAMRQGKSEAQIKRAVEAVNDFVVANSNLLSALDIAKASDYGTEVDAYFPDQGRAKQSDLSAGYDYEGAILTNWESQYGIHYS